MDRAKKSVFNRGETEMNIIVSGPNLVIQILDGVYGLIYTACANITTMR